MKPQQGQPKNPRKHVTNQATNRQVNTTPGAAEPARQSPPETPFRGLTRWAAIELESQWERISGMPLAEASAALGNLAWVIRNHRGLGNEIKAMDRMHIAIDSLLGKGAFRNATVSEDVKCLRQWIIEETDKCPGIWEKIDVMHRIADLIMFNPDLTGRVNLIRSLEAGLRRMDNSKVLKWLEADREHLQKKQEAQQLKKQKSDQSSDLAKNACLWIVHQLPEQMIREFNQRTLDPHIPEPLQKGLCAMFIFELHNRAAAAKLKKPENHASS